MNLKLFVVKVNEDAITPSYGSEDAIGLDLHVCGDHGILRPMQFMKIRTGILAGLWDEDEKKDVKKGHYLRIAPRSGLADKNGIDILAGVVDLDYRGEIKVIVMNLGNEELEIRHGMKIAQMIIEKAEKADVEVVKSIGTTKRGEGGFGSTGL